MRVIDIFANMSGQMAKDGHVHRYGYVLVTQGIKGISKLNPTAVWVDATVAVIEAAGSYFNYCAQQQLTEQLRIYNHTLEVTLEKEFKIGEFELKKLFKERKNRLACIDRDIDKKKNQIQLTNKKIRQQFNMLKKMHILLQKERLKTGGFQELINLQVCLDSCIDASLSLLLNPSGE